MRSIIYIHYFNIKNFIAYVKQIQVVLKKFINKIIKFYYISQFYYIDTKIYIKIIYIYIIIKINIYIYCVCVYNKRDLYHNGYFIKFIHSI